MPTFVTFIDIVAVSEAFQIAVLRQGGPEQFSILEKLCACTVATLQSTDVNSNYTSVT